jgi:1-acyl-sn-glycerol-3-phosphate acyltransferase
MSDWLTRLWYDSCFVVSWTGMTLGFSLRTEGMHHIPRRGPVLVIANHQSYLDPIVVGLAARRRIWSLARKTLFRNPLFGLLMHSLNAIPVDLEGIGIQGLRMIIQELERGRAVMVFPEGDRTWDGVMKELRPGIHLLIKKVPEMRIVPMGIAGAYEAWPRWRRLPYPAPLFLPAENGTIAVSVGPPLDASRFAKMPRQQALAELFDVLHDQYERAERLRRKPY